jgi:D-3-phosphoglycerate dehydrogenase
MKVVVLDRFPDTAIETAVLDGVARVEAVDPGAGADVIGQAVRDADGLLLGLLRVDAGFIAQLTRCQILARFGVGVESIDLEAAQAAGIQVTNVPDASTEEVALHAIALALALIRRIPTSAAQVRQGGWGFANLGELPRVSQCQFGVIGLGRIGSQVARLAGCLGFDVAGYDHAHAGPAGVRALPLDQLLATSDVVSLHLPLTPATHHLISADRLATIKPGAILINTARGGLIDTAALCQALVDQRVGAAGLDTLEGEPAAATAVADTPNLLLTGHIGFYSRSSIADMRRKAAHQVRLALTGQAVDYPVQPRNNNQGALT